MPLNRSDSQDTSVQVLSISGDGRTSKQGSPDREQSTPPVHSPSTLNGNAEVLVEPPSGDSPPRYFQLLSQ